MRDLSHALQQRQLNGLYRRRRTIQGPQQVETVIDGQPCLAFSSNDYLGLANHPVILAAMHQGVDEYGCGSGASHLMSGHSRAHHALEEELADFLQRPRALLFSSGYLANLGIVTALTTKGDRVYEDRLNHASLIDAGLLSGARLIRYTHKDAQALDQKLDADFAGQQLVVTDGVFSMDGDIAPIRELAASCQKHRAMLMVDDAHGIGVLGERGRGSLEHLSVNTAEVDVLMGTLGKAFGCFGAFVVGSEEMIETFINAARSYIYTTALPPSLAVAASASLKLLQQENWRREKLQALIAQFRQGATEMGLEVLESDTPVQAVILGDSQCALDWSEALWQKRIHVPAIRPPTVAEGRARLRISFSAAHQESHVQQLLRALEQIKENA